VLVVGHQPTLGTVASFLLSGEEAYWSVRKGAVWWLSNRAKEGGAAVVLKVVQSPEFV
jgi:phosphohistidine phosphatase